MYFDLSKHRSSFEYFSCPVCASIPIQAGSSVLTVTSLATRDMSANHYFLNSHINIADERLIISKSRPIITLWVVMNFLITQIYKVLSYQQTIPCTED